MHADSYWYAGGFDDWFLDCDSSLTADDLSDYFLESLSANGADSSSDVDALTIADAVTLKATDSVYPSSGQLITAARECSLTGNGRVSIKAEYSPGETSISLVETATSDDLSAWTQWQAVGKR
jgi:hypothetical protein